MYRAIDPISPRLYLERHEALTEGAANAAGVVSLAASLAAVPTGGATVPVASAAGYTSAGFSAVNGVQNVVLGNSGDATNSFIAAGGGVATAGFGSAVDRGFEAMGGSDVYSTSFVLDLGGWGITNGVIANQ
ncbi:hypothetical protein GCM10009718_04890 [Isoptericola halotolerans]